MEKRPPPAALLESAPLAQPVHSEATVRTFGTFLLSAVLVGLFSACQQDPGDVSYEEAREAAVQSAATDEGESYRQAVGQQMLPTLHNAYQTGICAPAIGTIELLLRVSATGETAEVRALPENQTSACLVEVLRDQTYPSPPSPDFWIRFETNTRPKQG